MLSTVLHNEDGTPAAWWECEKGKTDMDEYSVHRMLFPHVQALEEDQSDVHLQNLLNAKLYSNRELMAFEWNTQITASFRPLNANLENLVQSAVDTMFSRLAPSRPRPKIQTRGASFDIYRKGRLLDRYAWGEFQGQDVYSKAERAWILDPMVYGTGFMKADIDWTTKEIFSERVHSDEIIVDQRECVSNDMPQSLAQRKLVSRLWLLKRFGSDKEAREKILEAQSKSWRYTSYRSPSEDQIVLIQAWHLPTYPGAADGREVLCIENHTLSDKKYKRDRFPFVWVKWRDPENGFYGLPLVSDIMGYQINQNEMNDVLRAGRDLACVPRIFLEQGSDVQIHQIDNTIGKFIRYRGTMPECITWPAFNPEMYNERDRNRSTMYEMIGLSESLAQASAPTSQTRFDSSDALKEFDGQQDRRLIKHAMKLEKAYLELADHFIELAAILYGDTSKTSRKVMYHNGCNVVQEIDWSSIDLKRDRFVMTIAASSVLSMSPAARTDKLEGWLRDGKISLEQYYSLSGEPDFERLTDRLAGQQDHIEAGIDLMLKGKEWTPTPFDNLELVFNLVHDELMRLMSLQDPEAEDPELNASIDAFVQCLELTKEMMSPTPDPMMQMASPEMQMAPMGAPPMAPQGMMPPSVPAVPAGGPPPGPGAPVPFAGSQF